MKTLSLQIDDNLYEALIALLKQLPENKVKILEPPQANEASLPDFEQAADLINV